MFKILAAAGAVIAAGVGVAALAAVDHPAGPAHAVTVPAPAVSRPAPQPVTVPAPATTTTTAAPRPMVPAPSSTTVPAARPRPTATPVTASAICQACHDGAELPPATQAPVWVAYPDGRCGQVAEADAQHNHLKQIPASECQAGDYRDPSYVPPSTTTTSLSPAECAQIPACYAGNGRPPGSTSTTTAPASGA